MIRMCNNVAMIDIKFWAKIKFIIIAGIVSDGIYERQAKIVKKIKNKEFNIRTILFKKKQNIKFYLYQITM